MRKIIFFDAAYPPPIVGGKEKQAHELAKNLKNIDIKVIALTSQKIKQFPFRNYEGIKRLGIPYLLIPLVLIILRFFSNTIHIHTPSRVGLFVLIFSKLLGFKTLFKIPNMDTVGDNKFTDKLILLFSNYIIALEENSYSTLMRTKKSLKLDNKDQIKLIPNLVAKQKYAFKTNNEIFNIAFCGRLVDQKNPFDFLKVIYKLKYDNGLNIRAHIIGDGYLYHKLIDYVREFKINDCCKFYKMHKNPSEIFSRCQLLVSTSKKEGMSNVLLESMAIGIPVITSKVGAAAYLLGAYKDKFTFLPGDIESIVERIILLKKDQKLQKQYSNFLYRQVNEINSPNRIIPIYGKLYMN
ncbi:glycosyltransferase [uncultured Prochlorococcus sp.]|uniref:glycosyltransferase n=1 Tax=uncultured Prochlorococcus sp. TaxID=159733 RepID=UPI00258E06C1|nr:glycosyltransferase [uncultured Prochlorococcus sp.]